MGELVKADIFSLGVSLFELIIGEDLPKNGDKWQKIRQGIRLEDFGINQNQYSDRLKNLIIRLMDPDFHKRPNAVEILESDYLREKENLLKWERIRGLLLRQQLEDLRMK